MAERAILVLTRSVGENERRVFLRETEMRSLIETLGIKIVYELTFTVKEINPTTYLGPGQVEEIKEIAAEMGADEVVIDSFLTPRQENKIEKILSLPVSDREAVILAIFFQNAHSREAKLQINKANMQYLKARLIYREANLMQQRGGVRGAKGEGEKRIEIERRNFESKILNIDKELKELKKNREVEHKRRERNSDVFSFALTGYTNAGKSTILNTLTQSSVLAEDKLFATLDTTTRSFILPSKRTVLISDTVGFIQNLPSSLIEAFSSTLKEALSSQSIIVVADSSHPDSVQCFKTTVDTLTSLGVEDKIDLVVINKIDSYYDDISLSYLRNSGYRTVETSMTNGLGIDDLIQALIEISDRENEEVSLLLSYSSPLFSLLSEEKRIREVEYKDDKILVKALIPKGLKNKYLSLKRN